MSQPSFLNPDGTPRQEIIDAIQIQDRFRTEEQVQRAQGLVASGLAKNAQEAWEIMTKEDAEDPVNDAHSK